MTDKIFHPLFRRLTTKQIGAGPCKTEGQPTQSTGNSHRRYDISFACMMGHTVRLKVLLNDGSLLARVWIRGVERPSPTSDAPAVKGAKRTEPAVDVALPAMWRV